MRTTQPYTITTTEGGTDSRAQEMGNPFGKIVIVYGRDIESWRKRRRGKVQWTQRRKTI